MAGASRSLVKTRVIGWRLLFIYVFVVIQRRLFESTGGRGGMWFVLQSVMLEVDGLVFELLVSDKVRLRRKQWGVQRMTAALGETHLRRHVKLIRVNWLCYWRGVNYLWRLGSGGSWWSLGNVVIVLLNNTLGDSGWASMARKTALLFNLINQGLILSDVWVCHLRICMRLVCESGLLKVDFGLCERETHRLRWLELLKICQDMGCVKEALSKGRLLALLSTQIPSHALHLHYFIQKCVLIRHVPTSKLGCAPHHHLLMRAILREYALILISA
jgi:hypothetical protein